MRSQSVLIGKNDDVDDDDDDGNTVTINLSRGSPLDQTLYYVFFSPPFYAIKSRAHAITENMSSAAVAGAIVCVHCFPQRHVL